MEYECLSCKHRWNSRKGTPKICAKCKTKYWNTAKKSKEIKKGLPFEEQLFIPRNSKLISVLTGLKDITKKQGKIIDDIKIKNKGLVVHQSEVSNTLTLLERLNLIKEKQVDIVQIFDIFVQIKTKQNDFLFKKTLKNVGTLELYEKYQKKNKYLKKERKRNAWSEELKLYLKNDLRDLLSDAVHKNNFDLYSSFDNYARGFKEQFSGVILDKAIKQELFDNVGLRADLWGLYLECQRLFRNDLFISPYLDLAVLYNVFTDPNELEGDKLNDYFNKKYGGKKKKHK